jgi:hypothetical protein
MSIIVSPSIKVYSMIGLVECRLNKWFRPLNIGIKRRLVTYPNSLIIKHKAPCHSHARDKGSINSISIIFVNSCLTHVSPEIGANGARGWPGIVW